MAKKIVHYHLPGLFEFYELYARFLPLTRAHPEYFYDWCDIASIYGAPANCLWGGGRVGAGDVPPRRVLALLRAYGISARLTFSNSLLGPEHLADARCNRLCRLLAEDGNVANGVIVHSDLLTDYLRQTWPQLYLVSSTTKVLTDFAALRRELERPEFRYVVPDFRLNKAFAQLAALPAPLRDKVEFLCNECCRPACPDRKACYEAVSRKNLGLPGDEHRCTAQCFWRQNEQFTGAYRRGACIVAQYKAACALGRDIERGAVVAFWRDSRARAQREPSHRHRAQMGRARDGHAVADGAHLRDGEGGVVHGKSLLF